LLKTKYLPVLYYCLKACFLKKAQLNAVDIALNCTFRKIFSTSFQEVVEMYKQLPNTVKHHPTQWLSESVNF